VRTYRNHLISATVAVVILTLLQGCTTENGGNPAPATTSGTQEDLDPPATSSAPAGGSQVTAPRVATPLKGDKFTADPCSTLSTAQLTEFAIANPGEKTSNNDGTICNWQSGTSGQKTGIAVIFAPSVKNGLSNAYSLNSSGTYKDGYFEPTEISGYPAVYNDLSDQRASGTCNLTVGISDQSVFGVVVQGRAGTDGCKAASNVAKAVLQTIKGAQ
jgi:hypothetical protein